MEKESHTYARLKEPHVLLSARREDRLIEIKRKITEEWSGQCEIFPLDVGRLEDIARVRDQIGSVDVLINNAGFGIFETVLDSTLDDMKAMFDVNVFGLIACTKAVLPQMLEQKRAISSISPLKRGKSQHRSRAFIPRPNMPC